MRRRASSEGANLDSLMDTLTNVVGILIFILILVQVNAARGVKKIISDLKPVSVAEVERKRKEVEELRQLTADDEKRLQQHAAAPKLTAQDLAKLDQDVLQLERDIQNRRVPLLELETLRKKVADQEKLEAARNAEMAALMAERDRLTALLHATPMPIVEGPKIVRIPNARPVPENANLQRFILSKGNLYHFDVSGGVKAVMDDFTRVKKSLERERIQRNGRPFTIYDQEKIVNYFASRKPSLKGAEATVMPNRPWTQLYIQFKPKEGGGETVEQIQSLSSQFQSLLRSFPGRTVVWFHVMPDSFDLYLKARELADRRGLPAGWEIAGAPIYNETLTEFEVNRLEAPPPAGDPPKILPPKKSLD